MKIKMTMEILNVIRAVQTYKRWLYLDNEVTKSHSKNSFDTYELTYEYFRKLPLPEELPTSFNCYNEILHYDVTPLMGLEAEELGDFYIGFWGVRNGRWKELEKV